ncbi:hypothetical protein PILCRDRAFT_828960 [Piloderma croceum F 1598]|uniref:Nephrocystin 3-like N-terminal domain-containing protein n=1 Tax=Piloderma croceum (strain F 1598) TaxID=765440 RepID=A0A0C3EM66_PILCF|nr:hypothetical protein PILCRDRAFT_828960 [Piloderma croceum F 1598]
MGEVSFSVREILTGNCTKVENTFKLQKHGSSKPGKRSSLDVHLRLVQAQSESTEVDPEPEQADQMAHAVTCNDQPAVISPDGVRLPQKDEVDAVFGEADRGAASLSNVKGMSTTEDITDAVNTSMTLTGSDGFTLVCGYVEKLMNIGDVVSEIHPWASLAWSILSVIPRTLVDQVHRDRKVQDLWTTAADMLAFLKDAKLVFDTILAPIVSDMMKQIYHCALFIREYGGKGFFKRSTQEMLNSSDGIISQYNSAFQQLKERFVMRSGLATLKVLHNVKQGVVQLSEMLDNLKDMEQIKSLENLRGAHLPGVRCDVHAVCLPMTRESLLIDIMRWITDPNRNRIFWLHGFAGSGKSTVANTIASRYIGTGLLGASFRFNRDIDGRNGPMFLFRNIAYQLALFDGHFRESLLQAITTYGSMNSFALREQLERFIVEPMHEVSFVAPVLIVIDAIDECGIENEQKEVLWAHR